MRSGRVHAAVVGWSNHTGHRFAGRAAEVLWAYMIPVDLEKAKKALCRREGIGSENCSPRMSSWRRGEAAPDTIPGLVGWAELHGLDAAVWTALGPRFDGEDRSSSGDEVIGYLRGLKGPVLELARQYVELAPRQIDTDYRHQIEVAIGWSCRHDRLA